MQKKKSFVKVMLRDTVTVTFRKTLQSQCSEELLLSPATCQHVLLKSVCVFMFVCFGIYELKYLFTTFYPGTQTDETVPFVTSFLHSCCPVHFLFFLPEQTSHTSHSHTVISVLLLSVRNHAVHFISQLVLKARNRLTGSASYEVSGSALHVVHTHVTGFGDLPLGKAHKLGVPGVHTETLGDQDLTQKKSTM